MSMVVGRVAGIPPSPHRLPRASELVTPALVESEILRLSALLEATTDTLARSCEEEAATEVAFKGAEAVALLTSEQKSAELRKADALTRCKREFAAYRAASAVAEGLKEKCRTLRAQLDSLRTIAANVRAQS